MLNPLSASPDVTMLPIPAAVAVADAGPTQMIQIRFADLLTGAEPMPVQLPTGPVAEAPAVTAEGYGAAVEASVTDAAAIDTAPDRPATIPIPAPSLSPDGPATAPHAAPGLATGSVAEVPATAERVRQLTRQSPLPADTTPRAIPVSKATGQTTQEAPDKDRAAPEALPVPPMAVSVIQHIPHVTSDPIPDPEGAATEPGPISALQPAPAFIAPLAVAAPAEVPVAMHPTPVNITAHDWPTQIADRLATAMIESSAEPQTREISIDITPEHLGPLRLRVSVTEKGTEISVAAAHPEVAHLLKDAQPDLQRALAEGGQPAFQQTGSGTNGTSSGTQQQPGWRSSPFVPRGPAPTLDPTPSLPRADPAATGLNLIA